LEYKTVDAFLTHLQALRFDNLPFEGGILTPEKITMLTTEFGRGLDVFNRAGRAMVPQISFGMSAVWGALRGRNWNVNKVVLTTAFVGIGAMLWNYVIRSSTTYMLDKGIQKIEVQPGDETLPVGSRRYISPITGKPFDFLNSKNNLKNGLPFFETANKIWTTLQKVPTVVSGVVYDMFVGIVILSGITIVYKVLGD